MLEKHRLPIDHIRVPVKRVRELDPAKVETLAEDMLENGQKIPIRCRVDPKSKGSPDGPRYILVEGQHRLEALRALGEAEITAYLVNAALK
ncbi:MAG: ParB N-terminal domain-containing protein [Pseudomonadota bacterium]